MYIVYCVSMADGPAMFMLLDADFYELLQGVKCSESYWIIPGTYRD